jgi:hypothetical protein
MSVGVKRVTPVALVLASLIPSAAMGNGRFPAAQFVTLGPGPRADRIAVRTTFGLVVSLDAGASWSWVCEELFEYSNGAPWDPPIAWGGQSAGVPLFVGIPDGLSRTRDLCASARVTEAARDFTGDVTTTVDGETVYWVGSNGTGPNRVLVSRDGGATFTTAGTIADGVLPLTIEAAGARAQRVYVTAVATDGSRAVLLRSDDGGGRFEDVPLDLHGGRDAYLAGVDATNPDVVYLRSALPGDDAGLPGGTLLLRSTDGARHFSVIARTTGPMLGFALSGDGRTVWYGGPEAPDRLWRSDDGGGSFARVNDVRVLCLRWHANALYVCAPFASEGYALGRSSDGGRSVSPVVRFETLRGPPACAAGSVGSSVCAQRWPVIRQMFAPDDAGTPDASTRDATADGPAAPPPTPPSCACRATRRTDATHNAALLGALWFVRLVRRRRLSSLA